HNDETVRRGMMDAQRKQFCSYILFINNEPKAFWYCFKYGKTLYLAATGYDPQYRNYELGTILLMKIFEDYCGSEIDMVDCGLGDADYKQRFGTDHFMETSFMLFPKTMGGLYLNGIYSSSLLANRFAKTLLDRLHITQRLKTIWRRGKSRSAEN